VGDAGEPLERFLPLLLAEGKSRPTASAAFMKLFDPFKEFHVNEFEVRVQAAFDHVDKKFENLKYKDKDECLASLKEYFAYHMLKLNRSDKKEMLPLFYLLLDKCAGGDALFLLMHASLAEVAPIPVIVSCSIETTSQNKDGYAVVTDKYWKCVVQSDMDYQFAGTSPTSKNAEYPAKPSREAFSELVQPHLANRPVRAIRMLLLPNCSHSLDHKTFKSMGISVLDDEKNSKCYGVKIGKTKDGKDVCDLIMLLNYSNPFLQEVIRIAPEQLQKAWYLMSAAARSDLAHCQDASQDKKP
jgi:hypothetical protein